MAIVKEDKVIYYNGIQANLVKGVFYRDNHPMVVDKPELFIIEKANKFELLVEEPVQVQTVVEIAEESEDVKEEIKPSFSQNRKPRRR